MGEIQVKIGEDQDVELDEIDVRIAQDTLAFDVTGRIVGLDGDAIGQFAGEELVPTKVTLECCSNKSE